MLKIALINMPFATLNLASIGLTQLKAILDRDCADAATTQIFYLNHWFAGLLGFEEHDDIASTVNSANRGFGDWLFRQAAFPDLPDNTVEYFRRYFPRKTEEGQRLLALASRVRPQLKAFGEELIDRHGLDHYDIVGFTSMFSQTVPSIAMARQIRARNPKVILVMGGANCEAPMGSELVRNVAPLDYVFSGPALKSFPRFVRLCAESQVERAREIPGVFSKERAATAGGDVEIGDELDIDDVVDLDYRPFMDLVAERWPGRKIPISLPFETSRGCWWGERAHCTFCGLNGMTMTYHSMEPQRALKLINSLFQYDGVDRLLCVDNILPKSYLKTVFPALNPPDSTNIFYEVKADLTEEDVRILARARVTAVQPGIEALDTSTLKLMRKGVTSFTNILLLMNCLTHVVQPVWNLLIGFPGEESEVFERYLKVIPTLVHLPPPTGVYPVRFDRYSPYFKEATDYGLRLEPLPFYSLTYSLPAEACKNIAYYFGDRNYGAPYMQMVARYIAPLEQAIAAWQKRWSEAPPELYVERPGETPLIYDSRSAAPERLELDAAAGRLLAALSSRMDQTRLRALLPELTAEEVETSLQRLMDRRLLFTEGDRFMSVVLKQPTRMVHSQVGAPRRRSLQ
jgi:ribosomal peptide maturation radical SAM protein 1